MVKVKGVHLDGNSVLLMLIERKAIKLGWDTSKCFCQEVARRADEMGNNHPSDKAIKIAEGMVEKLERERIAKLVTFTFNGEVIQK